MGWIQLALFVAVTSCLWRLFNKDNYIMSQLDDLNSVLDSITDDVATVTTEFSSLETEIAALQAAAAAGGVIDLTAVLAKTSAIKTSLDAIATAGTTSPATPVITATPDEPAPEQSA